MQTDQHPIIHLDEEDGVTIVRFDESHLVDQDLIRRLGERLSGLVEEHRCRRLLLNFGGVRYISSSIIGGFIATKKRLDAVGGSLKLSDMHPDFLEIFELLRLEKTFSILPDQEAALAAFKAG